MSDNDLIEASPCKLRNGNWGCKTQQPVQVGDTVRIVTRANKQWRAEITQIVWTDDQTCICETASENSKSPRASSDQPAAPSKPQQQGRQQARPVAVVDDTPAPPRTDAIPTDELDAMADAAAQQDDEYDDLMSAMQAFERDPQ
ncbi:hypothetical protein [Salinisphaera hydrothermalis]|uniref:Uncharacterized protein n=1 Tax=Salinisphaera hydrothermalis (strain C41B8) TaxID=1304275 RepID=A0A084II23_SALHC|nr:hypothetical protein [Salinisphaera hydrothermalis]KEZ76357.1 hypothetical protein C41B8_15485 [Salinisphaera hydrothermalis C41B8]